LLVILEKPLIWQEAPGGGFWVFGQVVRGLVREKIAGLWYHNGYSWKTSKDGMRPDGGWDKDWLNSVRAADSRLGRHE